MASAIFAGWRRALFPLCVALVVYAGCSERVHGYAAKACLLHDEAIALLSAACHQGDYEHARFDFANRWMPAPAWKGLLSTDRFACFGVIRLDLIEHDFHPPLYFWLLHVAGLVAGFGPATGARLNTVVHGVGLVSLMLLARAVTRSTAAAIFAAVLWSFSAVAFETTYFARQYELLGALGIVTVLLVRRTLTTSRPRSYAAALAVSLGAMTLTHWYGLIGSFYVGLVAVGLAAADRALQAAPSRFAETSRFRHLAAACAGGVTLTFVFHPRWVGHLLNASAEHARAARGVATRSHVVLRALGGFFGLENGDELPTSGFIAVSLAVVALLVPAWQARRAVRDPTAAQVADTCVALVIPLFAAITIVPFALGFGPAHAMSARYLSLLSPMWALGLAWAFVGIAGTQERRSIRFIAMAAGSLAFVLWPARRGHAKRDDSPPLCGGETGVSPSLPLTRSLVADSTVRGTFVPVLQYVRDDARIFAFPPPSDAVADRPTPPPLNRFDLVRGLAQMDAVSLLHRTSGTPPRAAQDLRLALAAAGLSLVGVNEWPFAMPGFVSLVTYRPSRSAHGPSDAIDALVRRGSSLKVLDGLEGYAAVLDGGRLLREVFARTTAVRLTSSDVAQSSDYTVTSGPASASIVVDGVDYASRVAGFTVVLYDPDTRDVVYRAVYPAGRPRQRDWSDLAVRLR